MIGGTGEAHRLARRVVSELEGVAGVTAVALGGSWARGTADSRSDLDIGIYYEPHRPLDVDALRRVADDLAGEGAGKDVTRVGEWGPWIDGGAWLLIDGCRVDWLYRDLDLVRRVIDDAHAGLITCDYQPGHPHGFVSSTYAGEIDACVPLTDPSGILAEFKASTSPYPVALRRAVVDRFGWEAGFALETGRKAADRGDVFYVAGCLFRATACMLQVLFALNARYLTNEKGAIASSATLERRPEGLEGLVEILAEPGSTPDSLRSALDRALRVVEGTLALDPDDRHGGSSDRYFERP